MRKASLRIALAMVLAAWSLPAFAIQCVPYAREVSGLQIKGDAWQWWTAAAGLYDRGRTPKESSVLVFARQGKMNHGHVSVVTRTIGSRVVLVDHANWAPARSRARGSIATNVPVMDVSPDNDWSQVRVWHAAAQDYGSRVYRTQGFIWKKGEKAPATRPAIHQAALSRADQIFPAKTAAPTPIAASVANLLAETPSPAAAKVTENQSSVVRTAKAIFRHTSSHATPFN